MLFLNLAIARNSWVSEGVKTYIPVVPKLEFRSKTFRHNGFDFGQSHTIYRLVNKPRIFRSISNNNFRAALVIASRMGIRCVEMGPSMRPVNLGCNGD